VVNLIPASLAKKYKLIPVRQSGNEIVVAMTDPTNILAIDEVRFATGLKVIPRLAKGSDILELIERFYSASGTDIANLSSEEGFGRKTDYTACQ